MAGVYSIACDQGSTFLFTVTWTQPLTTDQITAGDTFGTPVNLTGYGARMQVRSAAGATDLEIDASTTNGMITLGGSLGTVAINVPAFFMTGIAAGSYKYDIDVYSGDATPIVTRLVQGSFKVNAEVTILDPSIDV
jgi:hypothetical protein